MANDYPVTTGDGGPLKVFQRMVEGDGHFQVLEMVCDELCAGKNLWTIAKANRWPVRALREWIEGDEERRRFYNLSLQIGAEACVTKVQEFADSATPEDYQQKRFQAQTYQWLASKLDRARFGDDKQGPTVNNQITIIHESQ
jgi:hypothetical protein